MSEIEELKQLKEKLLLEREVRRLERSNKLEQSSKGWSWWLVGVPAAIGVYFLLVSIAAIVDGEPSGVVFLVLSALLALPLIVKFRYR